MTVAAYVDLNAVRAGLVQDPKDYHWCGYAEAVGGKARARTGLSLLYEPVVGEGQRKVVSGQPAWRAASKLYRGLLFGEGGKQKVSWSGKVQGKLSAEAVETVEASGGKLSLVEA